MGLAQTLQTCQQKHITLRRHSNEVSVREAKVRSLPRPLAPDYRKADEGCLQILFAAPGHHASAFSDTTLALMSDIPERVHRQVQVLIRCPFLSTHPNCSGDRENFPVAANDAEAAAPTWSALRPDGKTG